MNKFILIAVFFALLVSMEVIITALAAEVFGVCMIDSVVDGEGEKDSKEKSEKDKKIEILLNCSLEEDDIFSRTFVQLERSIFSKPYLDQTTPPPEV